tara:strand:- start:1784 stop:2248 length:465 start_codon:yes stop_codon:yes gene_type:complete
MQTFLPEESFIESIQSLDWRRLGKQRVEAKQILNVLLDRTETKGWRNHPITKMWRGYEDALKVYFNICVTEWKRRGFKNTMELEDMPDTPIEYPHWFKDERVRSSHRANLLRKDYEFYSENNWTEDINAPYVWFDTDKEQYYEQLVGTGVRNYL